MSKPTIVALNASPPGITTVMLISVVITDGRRKLSFILWAFVNIYPSSLTKKPDPFDDTGLRFL